MAEKVILNTPGQEGMHRHGKKRVRITRQKVQQAAMLSFLLIVGIALLYPLYYALFGSVSTNREFLSAVFLPIPKDPIAGLKNYATVFMSATILRTLAVTLGKIVYHFAITIFTSVLGGYVFAKLRFPAKRMFFMVLISSMMIPGVALIVPSYIWMARFPLLGGNDILGRGGSGFLSNPWVLVLTGWLNVYNIFLCRQAFASTGDEMAESAQMDGAGLLRVVFGIYTPLIRPILAVMFLNQFLGTWNDYMFNFIYMTDATKWHTIGNVVVALMDVYSNPQRLGGPDYPIVFAVAIASMVPPIIVYALLQRQFTEGLSMGAVKG